MASHSPAGLALEAAWKSRMKNTSAAPTPSHSAHIQGNVLVGFDAAFTAPKRGVSPHNAAVAASSATAIPITLARFAQPAITSPKYSTDASPGPNSAPSASSTSRDAQRGP